LPFDRPAVYTPFLRRFTDEPARELSETIQLYNTVRAAHLASRWSHPDIRQTVYIEIAEYVEDNIGLPENRAVLHALGRCTLGLMDQETTIFSFPEIEWPIAKLSMKEQLDLRRFLRAKEHFLGNQDRVYETLKNAICNIIGGLIGRLPPLAGEATLSVPLLSLMQKVGDTVDRILGTINTEEHQTLGLFTSLMDTFYENVCQASGIVPNSESTKRFITADKSDLPSNELVKTYLRNTPFLDLFDTPVPFAIPDEIRFSGHWIIAPPGRGKTTLLHSMLMDDFQKDAAVIVMDSKGDLIEPIRDLKFLEDRYIIIDPNPDHPIAINPLDIPKTDVSLAVANLEYIFSSLLESKMTPLQTQLFRSVLRALVMAFPNPTLETFRDLLTHGYDKYIDHIKKLPQDLQDFFSREFNTKLYEDRKREIIWRLRFLLENDTMRSMLLALKTRFDMGAAMDSGKVVIINNSKAKLGDAGAEFFGRFFIAQVYAAAQARAGRRPQDKKPVYFYIDECQNVIARDERITTILDECRSQKVAMILAHQRTEQITSDNVKSALANCGVRYANSDDEARYLAPRLRTSTEFLQSLRRGQFAAYVRDMTSEAISIQVTPVDFSEIDTLTYAEKRALTERTHAQYGLQPQLAPPIAPRSIPITEQALRTVKAPRAEKDPLEKPAPIKEPPPEQDPPKPQPETPPPMKAQSPSKGDPEFGKEW
jgi:Type IV secretion-system coupling protein DNA-binding domain